MLAEKQRAVLPDLYCGITFCHREGHNSEISTHKLDLLGNTGDQVLSNIVEQATQFMLACYGQSSCKSMTETRKKCGHPKLAETMSGHQYSVPCFLLLKPLGKYCSSSPSVGSLKECSGAHPTSTRPNSTWLVTDRRIYYSQANHCPARTSLAALDLLKLIH